MLTHLIRRAAICFILAGLILGFGTLAAAEDASRGVGGSGEWFTLRSGLENCRIRFEREKVGVVAFMGGSITEMQGWRDMVCAELKRRFPETKFTFIAAGISSTGSTPGAFRLESQVLSKGPVDLLFEEAAVNDSTNFFTPAEMTRGMEGIVRHTLAARPETDVVVMHFVDPDKMADYNAGREPVVVGRHEAVAKHYDVPSINLALEVTQRIKAGEFTWDKDFKGLHPAPFGQKIYFNTINRLFDKAWAKPLAADAKLTPHAMPEPLDKFSYYRGRFVALDKAEIVKGWKIDPSWKPGAVGGGTRHGFVDVPMMVGAEAGATLKLPFDGTAVGIFVAAGPDAGVVEYSVDGGAFKKRDLFTHWSGGLHIPWAYVLEGELAEGKHELTLRISDDKNAASKGHAARVAHFLAN